VIYPGRPLNDDQPSVATQVMSSGLACQVVDMVGEAPVTADVAMLGDTGTERLSEQVVSER